MEHPENSLLGRLLISGRVKTKQEVDFNHNTKIFTEDEIKRITSNYRTPIGKGGFGEVYRGILDYEYVAVKRYIRGDMIDEFREEVKIHSQMNQKNVVKLIGYCAGEDALTMVTEYITNGNLDDTLHNSGIPLPLDTRLGITIGCAEALSYMHSMHLSTENLVCHGDIKPANILLDHNLMAKVSDFGLSRLLSGGITRYTSNVKGSIDYMDPMYQQEGRLTSRSDIYSFGVVLLELLTRKRVKEGIIGALRKANAKRKGITRVSPLFLDSLRELFDAEIANESNAKILEGIAVLATKCLSLDIYKRPQMNEVVDRLCELWKGLRGGKDIGWYKSLGIFKRNAGNGQSEIIAKVGSVRILTKEYLNQVTQNYSQRLGLPGEVYKGTLEDNTMVAVKKFTELFENLKQEVINDATNLSQMVHKNIIKILGCCLEDDTLIFVYEYAAKGSLYNILYGWQEFPLDVRMKIAVKTAEALEYLHSSTTCIITHGCIVPSNILLDNNFMPKLTGFSRASWRINETEITTGVSENVQNQNQILYEEVLRLVRVDVFQFGILLFLLITRKNFKSEGDLIKTIDEFKEAYKRENTGKAFFDKDITAEEAITILDEIGRLVLKLVWIEDEPPTMKDVVRRLRAIR
ncbi:serine/threonine-protein kinase-like protein [Panicum miliaceum]|uniref:Serine/threonine-protein kinase-like protein n=1 Tax=Panicum miliaceum TaxID=4540 RepID=A0A3L6R9T6_PANMI|nr:serine/threonine-protein kinase-like protein [Panicum miliaceum]